MDPEEIERRAETCRTVIREAGRLALSYYRRRGTLAVTSKGVQDLVSEADRSCEELIVRRLAADFPEDSFLGEEGARRAGGPLVWIIDPIDGTSNFLRGIDHWCISIGLAAGPEVLIGAILDPIRDELFFARRGEGARLNDAPIRVSGETRIDRAMIGLGFSYRRPIEPHAQDIEILLNARCEYRRPGSGALGMAYTAAGRFDGYWERHINSWDVAAGLALVREAGGVTNDFLAGEGLTRGGEILAATPDLFTPLAGLLGRPGSPVAQAAPVPEESTSSSD